MKIWINADDFGLTKSCTNAIFDCFERGMITTTTLVANGDYFSYALMKIKNSPYLEKVGLHINLTEGKPLTKGISKNKKFCDQNGVFIGLPNRYSRLTKSDKIDLYNEIEAQFDRVIESGIIINHVDSHHHVHNSFRILPIVLDIMQKKNLRRLRIVRNVGILNPFKIIYKKIINFKIRKYSFSSFMGSMEDFEKTKKQNINGIFEIMVHPDYNSDNVLIDRDNGDYKSPSGPVFEHNFTIIR